SAGGRHRARPREAERRGTIARRSGPAASPGRARRARRRPRGGCPRRAGAEPAGHAAAVASRAHARLISFSPTVRSITLPAEWRTTVPIPSAISAYAVSRSAVPTTARAAAGSAIDTGGYAGAV